MPPAPPRLELVRGGRDPARPEVHADPPPDRRTALELTALGTGLVLTLALMARLASWAHELGAFQSLYLVAFAFYALALPRALRAARPAPAGGGVTVPHAALLVLAVAAAARLTLLPVTPTLSDDVYRYVWEGRVAAHGLDPYRTSPDDPALGPLRDRTIHPRINHPELATLYPPLSIAGFALVAVISPTVWAMKLWVILHDLALVAVLVLWTRRTRPTAPEDPVAPAPHWGSDPRTLAAIAYAWNPLVLVEVAGSGHHEPVAILWLVVALMLAERRPVASALALAAATLTKLAPLVALPFLLREWPARARVVALATLAAGLAWFWGATRGADSGLGAYARVWANNELAFHYLASWIGDPLRARVVAALLVAGLIVLLLRRRANAGRAAADTRTVLRAGFVLSPVAHPWYLAWLLAFEPLGVSAPWLLLSLTAVLSYGVLAPPAAGGAFHLPLAWRWIEYGAPLALAVALALWRGARSRTDVVVRR